MGGADVKREKMATDDEGDAPDSSENVRQREGGNTYETPTLKPNQLITGPHEMSNVEYDT